jgi:N-acetyl sugar amidotransferase
MDTTDSRIVFDANGVCDHCHTFDRKIVPNWNTGDRGRLKLEKLVAAIKKEGEGKPFDCMVGVSGGVDSSYLVYAAKKHLGLRPLVFHVDTGWNSQIAVNNIERLVDCLDLDLYTEVIDWDEMRDLQLAYIKSGVPQIDAPQDFAIFFAVYRFAHAQKVKYILTGANQATECIRNPVEWSYYGDSVQLRDIHSRFGKRPLKTFPINHILWHKVYLPYVCGIKAVRPLNHMPYVKDEAVKLLVDELGWEPYPQKHFESRYTKFAEGYWLPTRFGYDTRKVQYSSLILTRQMSRDEALEKLKTPVYDRPMLERDVEFIAAKLGISADEMYGYIAAPRKTQKDYKSQEWLFLLGARVMKAFGLEIGGKR